MLYPTCAQSRFLVMRIVDSELFEVRPGERGEMKRMLERELKVLGVAERAVKRITCTSQCASSAVSLFCFFFSLSLTLSLSSFFSCFFLSNSA